MKNYFPIFILIVLLSSCASKYNFIQDPQRNYTSFTTSENGIKTWYEPHVLVAVENKKQARKETKNNISVVAVKIENGLGKTLIPGQNCRFYQEDLPLYLFNTAESFKLLKQKWPYHLFYLGLTPFSGTLMIGGFYAAGPVGIVLGPGLSLYNSLKASKANKRLMADLKNNSLLNREIKPGETVSGIIVFDGQITRPIYLRAD